MTESARRYIVEGRVQGVGFRYFTRQEGRRLGLTGWVKNLPDGSVEVQAAGDEIELMKLKAALAEGPPGSAVAGVGETTLAAPQDWQSFEITYR